MVQFGVPDKVISNELNWISFICLRVLTFDEKLTEEPTPAGWISLIIALPTTGGPVAPDPVCALTTARMVLISSLRVLTLDIIIFNYKKHYN